MISTLKDYATRITINFQNKKGQIVLDQFSKALENGKYPEYVEKSLESVNRFQKVNT